MCEMERDGLYLHMVVTPVPNVLIRCGLSAPRTVPTGARPQLDLGIHNNQRHGFLNVGILSFP